ncbi:MAG: hemoglobin-like flavoprotein [Gammaproteobacteria bacterium]|jgi:hemoglobin-like flavoprotein
MEAKEIELVQSSWKNVKEISEQAAELFYGRIFELDPELKPLFKGDMAEQGRNLMTMIGTVVNSLSRLDAVVPAVQALGRRHVGYGVKDAHYHTVGAALLWALEQGLGEAYTSEVAAAWTETYSILASVMKDAAAAG